MINTWSFQWAQGQPCSDFPKERQKNDGTLVVMHWWGHWLEAQTMMAGEMFAEPLLSAQSGLYLS